MNISIKKRIYWSFSVLVLLFVVNGVASLITLNNNRKLSENVSTIINPSLQSLEDFEHLLFASKMYTTNWVFLRSNQEDKDALKRLHNIDYPRLKSNLNLLSGKWENKFVSDSLNKLFTGFEQLLAVEKRIMLSLGKFEDYDDPFAKLESKRLLADEVLPRTSLLINRLSYIVSFKQNIRNQKNEVLEESFMHLRMLISVLAITIIFIGIFLSLYMAKVIISPINKIRHIVNDLGSGIIRKVNHKISNDEIGEMVRSVNHLSEKLQATATFAHEIGSRNFDTFFQPLGNGDTLGKALISMRDNLKTSERELLDANAEIQTIYNASLDAVIIIDEEGKIVKWDHKAAMLFGWEENEVMGTLLAETIIPHRYREAHQRGMKHFLKTGEARVIGKTIEVSAIKKNKDEFDISLSISFSLIKGKYRFIGFIRDITERKIAEAELHKSEERYRQIVETAQEGIWMVDENNKTNFANKRLCELFGYSTMEMMGKEIFYFMDEEGKKIAAADMERRRQGISETFDFKFITKENAVVWAYLAASPVMDDKGKYIGALAMVTDITKRKLDEELLQKSQASLAINNRELEQKNKELEQFAYVASHDLQEPLRTTISFVEIFKKQYFGKLDSKADKYLNYIIQASDRMAVLIKDLLDFSRIGNSKDMERVDCNMVLREVIEDIGKAITDTGAVIIAGDLPVISGYPTEIKQLFQNLTVNAIKFRKPDTIPQIKISANVAGGHWHFSIADNGIGINKVHNERIFVIFQRLHTRTEYQGSGIGLSHCKKIVELHHGKIWVESVPGEGSVFYFTIPKKENPARILEKSHHMA